MIAPPLVWRTSSYSGNTGGNCVEVASDGAHVFIRDSKYRREPSNDPSAEPVITLTPDQWDNFVKVALNRSKGPTEPAIEIDPAAHVELRAAGGPTLRFTPQEWEAFTAGATGGEFDSEILAA
ncbi:DUF397 domain-containing protein [Nocardia vulneris]|uniref:DUF397 domain-containing protein n=1 Tax=Nocardia vulneris TaxID=1141657 RepID=A0ABR4Z708_9NOCA|nr:DUF397 domain-containing protein [Nocardia vulneris]KIA61117.1 hypothetical protein FG87_32825 [Nocardia vulneris]